MDCVFAILDFFTGIATLVFIPERQLRALSNVGSHRRRALELQHRSTNNLFEHSDRIVQGKGNQSQRCDSHRLLRPSYHFSSPFSHGRTSPKLRPSQEMNSTTSDSATSKNEAATATAESKDGAAVSPAKLPARQTPSR